MEKGKPSHSKKKQKNKIKSNQKKKKAIKRNVHG
jgi:hypothetical protein